MSQIRMHVHADPEDPDSTDISVPAAIGRREYWFRLDTGAAITQVTADEYLAAMTGLGSRSSSGAFGQAAASDIVVVRDLVLGEVSIPELEVRRVPADGGQQNLLGMDVLGRYCCRFSFDAGLLDITGSAEQELVLDLMMDDRGHTYLPLEWAGGATAGGATASACFDTGAGVTVVDRAFRDRHPELFTAAGTSVGTDATGASLATPMCWLAAPLIAGVPFPPAKVAIVDLAPVNRELELPMDLILGAPTISRANWLFHFPARRWTAPEPIRFSGGQPPQHTTPACNPDAARLQTT